MSQKYINEFINNNYLDEETIKKFREKVKNKINEEFIKFNKENIKESKLIDFKFP